MNERMKTLSVNDGSGCPDAALDDLKRAELPESVEATFVQSQKYGSRHSRLPMLKLSNKRRRSRFQATCSGLGAERT
jgi:hypothetical protein